jgi:invasion protein IalB
MSVAKDGVQAHAHPTMRPSNFIRPVRRTLAAAVVGASLAAAAASPASAGLLVKAAPSCAQQALSKPFTPWADHSDYTLTPGGAFEAGEAAWSLGGAQVKDGNEPFRVRKDSDQRSLELQPGQTATSPAICVGLEHPTLRFFAKGERKLLSALTVEVVTETSLGLTVAVPIGAVLPNGSWRPTPTYLVVANLLPLLPGSYTPVQFRLRAVGGSWNVDDVYVDPKRRA